MKSQTNVGNAAVRFLPVCVAVAGWMAVGYFARLGTDGYLLVGIPWTLLFQLGIARRPLGALWITSAPSARIDAGFAMIALFLVAWPAFELATHMSAPTAATGWFAASTLGALPAAYALRQCTRVAVRSAGWCLLTAGSAGVAVVVVTALARHPHDIGGLLGAAMAYRFARVLCLSFPAGFVLEEVAFRGALDTHVAQGTSESKGIVSAMFISALWGLWHLPLTPMPGSWPYRIAAMVAIHVVVGVPLSLARRRGASLLAPALTHALIDATRAALMID